MAQQLRRMMMLVALAAVCSAASAQTIGFVRWAEVRAKSTYLIERDQHLKDLESQLVEDFETRRTKYPLLLDEEFNRFSTLRRKDPLSADEQRELESLHRLNNDRDMNLARLESLDDATITPEQKAERQTLLNVRAQCQAQIRAMSDNAIKVLADEDAKVFAEVSERVAAAAKALAEEKGLAMILRDETILFGGQDVTADFITKLNATQ